MYHNTYEVNYPNQMIPPTRIRKWMNMKDFLQMLSRVQQGTLRARTVPGATVGSGHRGGCEEGRPWARKASSSSPSWISGAVSHGGALRQRVDLLALGGKVLSVIHTGPLPQGEIQCISQHFNFSKHDLINFESAVSLIRCVNAKPSHIAGRSPHNESSDGGALLRV